MLMQRTWQLRSTTLKQITVTSVPFVTIQCQLVDKLYLFSTRLDIPKTFLENWLDVNNAYRGKLFGILSIKMFSSFFMCLLGYEIAFETNICGDAKVL